MRALPVLVASIALTATACSPNGETATTASTTADSAATVPDTSIVDDISTGDDSRAFGDAATVDHGNAGSDEPAEEFGNGAGRFVRVLTPFSDCSAFLDHVKAQASERVGPFGLEGNQWGHPLGDDMSPDEASSDMASEMAADVSATAAPASDDSGDGRDGGGADFTGTNVQESGVDEPDIVKTDGERILTISENRLSYIDVTGDPVLTDTLQIPEGWGHELFIRSDRALLFTNGGEWSIPIDAATTGDAEAEFADPDTDTGDVSGDIGPERFGPATVIIEVDLSDPTDLSITATMRIRGQYLSARAIEDRVRLAVTSPPSQLPWLYPQNRNGEEHATDSNRRIIDESSLEDWVPSYQLTANGGTTSGPLLSCDRAHRPADFSGFDMVSIVDLDLGRGLAEATTDLDAVGVLASGQTVYSSTDRMYVATTKWAGADLTGSDDLIREWDEDFETDIHAFAIAPGEPTRYVASGTIAGSLLNQFSLDEHDGFLRAITTDGSPWSRSGESETHLVVLEEQGDRLVAVGEVGGLGKGEQLYSARLMGDVGFAVTFRQIDPFYVLDLSDPTDPRLSGELKIPGVSTYLHPVGTDRVLGIGQDATEDGRTTGLKLSLFDVADPSDPREIAVWTQPNSNSPAESDHRAFQMFGSTAILPVQSWSADFNGAVLFDIGDGITEIGRVSHVTPGAEPSSDCREITSDQLTPDSSELYWMTLDGGGRVQLCEPEATGGWGGWYCDRIPVDEIANWFYDPAAAETDLAAIGSDGNEIIEMCWPDGGHQDAIQRSLVIDRTLWTMTTSAIQANTLDDLTVRAHFSLR